MKTTYIYQDDLGYTFKVTETAKGATWRKKLYKNLTSARRAIRNWAEGSITLVRKEG